MRRSRGWRRYKAQCYIARRLHVIGKVWGWRTSEWSKDHVWFSETNRLNKYNLKCTCRICTRYRHEEKYNRAREKDKEIKKK